jgi:hypothetical protein
MTAHEIPKSLTIAAFSALIPILALDMTLCFANNVLLGGWFDPIAHGLLGLCLSMPFAFYLRPQWFWLGWGVFLSVALDVDHAIAAGSLDIVKMITMASRPPTHSFTFAVAIFLIVLPINRPAAWQTLIVLLAHILRDTSSGTVPLLWPLAWQPVAPLLYWAALPALWWGAKKAAIGDLNSGGTT